jgi:hypothetical protein
MRGEKLRANLPLFMGRTDQRGKFARWQKKRFLSVRYVVFGGGRTIFLVWGFALTKEKVVHTTLCTTYVEKIRPKTPSTSCFVGRMFQFLCAYVCFPLWKYDIGRIFKTTLALQYCTLTSIYLEILKIENFVAVRAR